MRQEGDTYVQRHTYLHKKAIQCLDVPLWWWKASAACVHQFTMETTGHMWLCKVFLTNRALLPLVQSGFCFWGLHLLRRDWKGNKVQKNKGIKNTHSVKYGVRLTQMTLCCMSSAWLNSFCSLAIRLWCKVSLRDPIKNWETSWTDQESGRSRMTCSTSKTRGLLFSRSTATLMRSSELR